jgi:hypothetical protein
MTWSLMCDKCGADQGTQIRGTERPSLPRGWIIGAFIHSIEGKDYRELSEFCPQCVMKYGNEIRIGPPSESPAVESVSLPITQDKT